jgi:lipoyl(octanoyl) transferase
MIAKFDDYIYIITQPIKYFDVIKIMYDRFDAYVNSISSECVFVLEHNNVYTIGKGVVCDVDYLHNVPVIKANRGGLWTFHGTGQVVVYFVYDIKKRHLTISDFLNKLEDFLINFFLQKYNITIHSNHKDAGGRGLWLQCGQVLKKVVFIGLQVKSGVLLHGLSINVANDMKFFDYIAPCGVDSSSCTSFDKEGLCFDINNFKSDLSIALYDEFFC